MSRYNFLDSQGLATYHRLSGYSVIPVVGSDKDVTVGILDVDSGTVIIGNNWLTTSNYTSIPKSSNELIVGDENTSVVLCYYDSDKNFVSSVEFTHKTTLNTSNTKHSYIKLSFPASIPPGDDYSNWPVIKFLHKTCTKWIYNEILDNKAAINDNKSAINDNLSLITRLHASHGVSVSPTTIEKGVSTLVTISNFYFKFDGTAITPGGSVTTTGDDFTGLLNDTIIAKRSIISDKTTFGYTIKHLGGEFTGSKTVSAYYPMYFGSSSSDSLTFSNLNSIFSTAISINTATDVSGVGRFAKQSIKASPAGSVNVEIASGGQYLWLLVPDPMTIKKVTSAGFDVPMQSVSVITGSSKGSYNAYRSASKINPGTMSIVIS